MYAPSIFEDRFMNSFLDDMFGKPVSAFNRMAHPMRTPISVFSPAGTESSVQSGTIPRAHAPPSYIPSSAHSA